MNTQVKSGSKSAARVTSAANRVESALFELTRSIIVREITVDEDVVALDETTAGEKTSGIDFGDRDLNCVRVYSDDLGMRFANRPGDRGLACLE